MFEIEIVPEALRELKRVSIFHRREIEKAIEAKLAYRPDKTSKNCKQLKPLISNFLSEPPLWELRVGEWRVFYDIEEEERKVFIRAIRKKPKGKTTKEIL